MSKNPKPAQLELPKPSLDAPSIKRSISNRLVYSIGKDPMTATDRDWFYSAAAVVRERLIERWMETMRSYYREDTKRVYSLSMEFLLGRPRLRRRHPLRIRHVQSAHRERPASGASG